MDATAGTDGGTYCVITAVLPAYRLVFLRELERLAPGAGTFFAGAEQFDPSVRTGVPVSVYRPVQNVYLLGRRLLVQRGTFRAGMAAGTTVVDLNPRSLTAWAVLVARRATGRRTLVWGHVHPRAGRASRTAGLRRAMRRLASGTITYTTTDMRDVLAVDPSQSVWAAPNALYTREVLEVAIPDGPRLDIVCVGRLEASKKPRLLVQAFALARPLLPDGAQLVLVGEGTERPGLERLVRESGLGPRVRFTGVCTDVEELRAIWSHAACAVSPGYVGLTLTQSLGFGVPMIVADDEPHAPEVELATPTSVTWFRAGDADDLAGKLVHGFAHPPGEAVRASIRSGVLRDYTADDMAAGFLDALLDRPGDGSGLSRVTEVSAP